MPKDKKSRRPAVAGQFYEADPEILKSQIDAMASEAGDDRKAPKGSATRALVMPHAGYIYSGAAATKTALEAKNGGHDRMLVLAPTHRLPMRCAALCEYDEYLTPCGPMPVDRKAVEKLASAGNPLIIVSDDAHDNEHSLEVELPILRQIVGGKKIIPIVCGQIDNIEARSIADSLSEFWDRKTLWVVSSDFTHYGRSFGYVPFQRQIPENLEKLDMGAAKKITDLDLDGFSEYLDRTSATICGANPIKILLAAIETAKKNGEDTRADLVTYNTSGALTGDYSHCVSYVGIVFYQA